MMLSDVLLKENVIPELSARDKRGVIEEMSEAVAKSNASVDKTALVQVLMEREKLGSTGIGEGVAIPHGKLRGLDRPMVAFGRSKVGVKFEAIDDQPADLFFLLIAPENASGVHLQLLAKIARLLGSTAVRDKLRRAKTSEELYKTITETDQEL